MCRPFERDRQPRTGLLFLLLGLGASTPAAQTHPSLPASIGKASLDRYRHEYRQSPLCSKDELTLWSCETGKRIFALCSSQVATRTAGYLQYRAASHGKLNFAYPRAKAPPLGLFTYNSFGNGDASVEFTNKGYRYSLIDPLRGPSSILVDAPGAAQKPVEIACGPNQTLQLNDTMRLMHAFGIRVDD